MNKLVTKDEVSQMTDDVKDEAFHDFENIKREGRN